VAWHLLWLTSAARPPEAAGADVLTAEQWQVLYRQTHPLTAVPERPPTLAEAIGWAARWGGFLARRRDGPPGVKTLWRGWRRLDDLWAGYRLAKQC